MICYICKFYFPDLNLLIKHLREIEYDENSVVDQNQQYVIVATNSSSLKKSVDAEQNADAGHTENPVSKLLRKLDCEEKIPKFVENEMDIEALQFIKPPKIHEVSQGFKWKTQIKFEHYLLEWQQSQV